MKVKILTRFPKKTIEVNNVWFSSDLHMGHQAVIDYGRKFPSLFDMDLHITMEINKKVGKNDLLVLLGDSMMGEKNYAELLESLICENVIMLYGNHCNRGKLEKVMNDYQFDKLVYTGEYLELNVEGQIICCSHYPHFCWNYQDDRAISLHGHLHGDTNPVVDEIHKYRSMDAGIDNYYKLFGEYSVFSLAQVTELLKDKLIIGRHDT